MKKMTLRGVPALMLLTFSGLASASGMQLWGQNASGLGVAYAGSAAVADNASTVFFNPAGMAQLNGTQLAVGGVGSATSYKFRDQGSSGLTGGEGGDAGGWDFSPNAYFSWRAMPDLVLGFGVSSPFGLATEYKDAAWMGNALALKSEIKTRNYNPALAYRLNDKVALGFGLDYQKIDLQFTKTGAVANFQANDTAWGWNAGALFTLSDAMRVGFSYRSPIKYKLQGAADGSAAQAGLKLPDTLILSVWQQVSDRWEAMGDLSYTRWHTFSALNITGAVAGSETFNFANAWRSAWGAAYKPSEACKLKFGIAYERSPVLNAQRTTRLPEGNQLWLSLGGEWRVGNSGRIDAGYSYLYTHRQVINQTSGANMLSGSYANGVNMLGLQYSVEF